jgi:bifunctional DNA-binding transcriptional regulator/antitoxin component of YhaV-PrlF toxin-antitoxin module
MLTKKTSKNQITIPKAIIAHFADVDYFDISEQDGRIILEPLISNPADAVRTKLAALGVQESDVEYAIKHARKK